MKFIHISDLHLGKRVNEFSMLEDQRDILKKILTVVDEEKSRRQSFHCWRRLR